MQVGFTHSHTIAIDIGATKISLALVSEELHIIKRLEIPSQTSNDLWAELAQALGDLCSEELTSFSPRELRVGIATAGPIDLSSGTISPVNILQWRQFPLVEQINSLFPGAKISMLGDCTALALAEHTIGAGVGHKNLLGVVVSTGIGGGLVINGNVLEGESGNAALIGHHVIAFNSDRICVCGRTGCLEEFARGPKMVEAAKRNGWQGLEDFKSLAQSASEGDLIAQQAIDDGARALAIGLVNAMMITDVHTVIIGGGVSFAGDVYWQPLRKHLQVEARFSGFLGEITVLPAKLGSDAGLIGAAIFAGIQAG